MNKGWFILLICALFYGTSVLAITDQFQYQQYQSDSSRTGSIPGLIPVGWVAPFTPIAVSTNIVAGSSWTPVADDLSSDGQIETVFPILNSLYLIQASVENLTTEVNVVGIYPVNNDTMTAPVISNFGVLTHPAILAVVNDKIVGVQWTRPVSGTDGFTTFVNNSPQFASTSWTGFACSGSFCYATTTNTTGTNLVTVDSTGTVTIGPNITIHGRPNSEGAYANNRYALACDPNNNGNYGYCVINTATGLLDPTFASGGNTTFLDDLATGEHVSHPMWITGSGGLTSLFVDYETTGTCVVANAKIPHLRLFSPSGASTWTFTASTSNHFGECDGSSNDANLISQLVYTALPQGFAFCGMQVTSAGQQTWIGCYNASNGARVYDKQLMPNVGGVTGTSDMANPFFTPKITNTLAVHESDSSSSYDMMLASGYVFNMTNSSMILVFNQSATLGKFAATYHVIADDIANQNTETMIASSNSAAQTYLYFFASQGGAVNNPPQINNSQSYGGYGGFYTGPTCKGTTITYAARECDGTNGIAGCDYTNDHPTDSETLTTNCGTSMTNTIGTVSSNAPTVNCFYNNTGTFPVTIYIRDGANPMDFQQYNTQTITVNVIDGIPGTSCNIIGSQQAIGSLPSGVTGAVSQSTQQTVDTSVRTITNLLYGSDFLLKFIVGILLVLRLLRWFSANISNHPMFLIFGFLAGLLITVLLTLTPVYVFMLFVVVGILAWMMRSFVTSARESG